MNQLIHYCCPRCGKAFNDGPGWTANTLHACPGAQAHMVVVPNPYIKPVINETLPWGERVNMISVHPEAASLADIAKMAAELAELKRKEVEPP